jgi:serine/threonine protein kinase
MRHELRDCRFVRVPQDFIPSACTVVYEHMNEDLLSAVKQHELSFSQRKRILSDILHALQEMHSKGWVHTGMTSVF